MASKKPTYHQTAIDMVQALKAVPDKRALSSGYGSLTDRVAAQKAFYSIYCNDFSDYVKAQIQQRYSTLYPDYKDFISPTINPFKRVATKKARAYVKAPYRTIWTGKGLEEELWDPRTAQDIQLDLQALTSLEEEEAVGHEFLSKCIDFDVALKEANGLHHSTRNPLVWPYAYSSRGESIEKETPENVRFRLRVIPPHYVNAMPADDYSLDVVAWWDDRRHYSCSIWNHQAGQRESFWLSPRMEIVEAIDLAFPIFVSSRSYQGKNIWDWKDALSLAQATLNTAESEAFENKVNFLRSYKQAIVDSQTNRDIQKSMSAGPSQFWVSEGDVVFEDMVDKDLSYLESIDKRLKMALQNENISALSYFGNPQTEQEFKLIRDEEARLFEEDVEVFSRVEQQLWATVTDLAISRKVLKKTALEWRIITEFVNPATLAEPKEEIELWEKKEKLGLTDVFKLVRQAHPYIRSRLEALRVFLTHKKYHAWRVNFSRALQLNEDGDTPKIRTAEETLQKIQGEITGPQGAPGPAVTSATKGEE